MQRICAELKCKPVVYKREFEDDCQVYTEIRDGQLFHVEGATLKAVATPGHTSDHTSFYLKEENALFSGDCILGQGSTVFDSLKDYMESLQKLKSLAPKKIYPGHGPVVENGVEKIDEYIAHRMVSRSWVLKRAPELM